MKQETRKTISYIDLEPFLRWKLANASDYYYMVLCLNLIYLPAK